MAKQCAAMRSAPSFGGVSAGFLSAAPLVRSDLPIVAARVPDHSAPISVRHVARLLEAHRAGFQRALVRRIDVLNIQVKKSRHRIARAQADMPYGDRRG